MEPTLTLFISLFTTLLAIINPLEAIPVYLGLIENKPEAEQRRVARQACFYATLLCFFFLIFGTLLLRIFEVPLSPSLTTHTHKWHFSGQPECQPVDFTYAEFFMENVGP